MKITLLYAYRIQVIAVKQLDRNGLQGNWEFLVEVLMRSLLHHPNLVNLLGYCADGDQRILVYEYMARGSLEDHLLDLPQDREPLDWTTRMKIADIKGTMCFHCQHRGKSTKCWVQMWSRRQHRGHHAFSVAVCTIPVDGDPQPWRDIPTEPYWIGKQGWSPVVDGKLQWLATIPNATE